MTCLRFFCRTAALAASVLISTGSLEAQLAFRPVSPDELKMTSEPQAPGAPAIILYKQIDRDNVRIAAVEQGYYRIKILTAEGLKQAEVQIPYLKGIETVESASARCIHPDGSITAFTGNPISKDVERPSGAWVSAMTMPLSGVTVGSIIEYYYSITYKEYWVPYTRWMITDDLFTKSAKFSLQYKPDLFIYPVWNWMPAGVPSPTYGDIAVAEGVFHIARLEIKNIRGYTREEMAPPESEVKSRMDFIFSPQAVEREPDKYWRRMGQERFQKLAAFLSKSGNLQPAVAETVSSGDAPEVKLQKLYNRVQRMKNADNPQAKDVLDIWKAGTGSQLQLDWLFLALVRNAGFEAHAVMTGNRRDRFFRPFTMDNDQLTASLVEVKLNGQPILCDPGTPLLPMGMLPWDVTGLQGLRLEKDGASWLTIPLPKSTDSRLDRVAHLNVLANGDVEGTLKVTYTGLEALRRRQEQRSADDGAHKWFLEDEAHRAMGGQSSVELLNHPDWAGAEPLVAEFKVKLPGWGSLSNGKLSLPAGIFTALEQNLFTASERSYAIYFQYPTLKSDDITFDFAAGLRVLTVPDDQKIDGGPLVYDFKSEKGGNSVHLTRSLAIDTLMLPREAYQPLQNFFHMLQEKDKEQMVAEDKQ